MSDKRSTLDALGIPKRIGVALLTIFLLLAISPYMGGADFGFVKVPELPGATSVLRYLGPVLLILGVLPFLPCWKKPDAPLKVDSDSKYSMQSITEIVKAEAEKQGISLDGLEIGTRLHINDLVRICAKVRFPEKSVTEVREVLLTARATAFTQKYAEPVEDEKLVDVSMIKIPGLKPWHDYFKDLLRNRGVDDLNKLPILNVGIGNGYAEEPFLSQIRSFKSVDISAKALDYAKKKYPNTQMNSFVCSAEDLDRIRNRSVDLYMSLRTYQSTLFDRRAALHEAYRVLQYGGLIVLSVPIMFLRKDGEVLAGLIPPGSNEPSMEYAHRLVARICDYLQILNFQDVKRDEDSPFEIFISAKR